MTGLVPRPSGRRRAAALAGAALAWLLIITAEGACSSQPPAGTVFPDPRVTPLAEAVAKDDTATIARLAKEGADVNARGESGVTLLQWALLSGNRRSLAALLDAGADPIARTTRRCMPPRRSTPSAKSVCCSRPARRRWRAIVSR